MFGIFKKSTIIERAPQPIELQLKSLSLPESTPSWRLFEQHRERWDVKNAIIEGYNASAIVFSCVRKRAELVASVPWVVKVKQGDEWIEQPNHPLQQLLDNPNAEQSWYEIMYEAVQSLDLAGDAYISEIRGGLNNLPFELWLLPAAHMKLKGGRTRLVDQYIYQEETTRTTIDPDDMINLRLPNPNSRFWGMPTLMAAGRATDIDRESGDWQKVSLKNRGVLDMVVEMPDGVTPEQAQAVKDKWSNEHAGSDNARRVNFSSSGSKIHQLGQTAVEMDFVESRRAVWTEICAAFGMSLANLGMTEAVNLANAEAMDKALWQNTIVPLLELIKRQLNSQLARDFGADVRLDYDLSNITALQQAESDKLENAEKYFKMGVPFNQINQHLELGLDPITGGDTGFIPSGLIPIQWAGDEPTPPTQDDEEKSFSELARKAHELTYGKG
ncbi:portal protein [Idiomarinaceae phage 1N2-2]|uniref:portal protein n=1 Tax=Idiomarinaceae phage 1N2-2 TaxID=1536592 RepID=UPI0004F80F2C|nr:portal protein [Idiomarinaceae phage 1N2-2]AIM40708.1 putative portal protein [Idiomarinaceae phage 1N2-2]